MKMYIKVSLLILFLVVVKPSGQADSQEISGQPVPTKITVHVLAHGAKAMYPRLGAKVVIRDVKTDKILDQGEVQGSSGDTAALMKAGYPRTFGKYGLTRKDTGVIAAHGTDGPKNSFLPLTPKLLNDKDVEIITYQPESDAAKFVGTIQISQPTVIRIEASGPLKHPQATMSDTVTALILPGHDVTGEGIVLNLRGLVVDIVSPGGDRKIAVSEDKMIGVTFNMSMMCGCPVFDHPDNPWKSDMFTFPIEAYYDGKLYYHKEIPARDIITGVSAFAFSLPLPENIHEKNREIRLRVMAAQPELANYGMDEVKFHIE